MTTATATEIKLFHTSTECETWYKKLTPNNLQYLYTVDKFLATFKPGTSIKVLNFIHENDLSRFIRCFSFIAVVCNLANQFQFSDDFTTITRAGEMPDKALFNIQ